MLIRFEWGPPTNPQGEEWTLDQIPRVGEHIELNEYSGEVRKVLWSLNTEAEPPRYVVVQLR